MPDYRSMYDRDYIGHFDLPGGKDLTLTIKKVMGGELTAVGGRKSKKPIVHFKQAVKPLICNKTNAKTIAAMYGNMVEEWAGKSVTLFVSTTRDPSGGGEVECIRIRPKVPKTAGASFDDDDDDGDTDAAPQSQPVADALPVGGSAEAAPTEANVTKAFMDAKTPDEFTAATNLAAQLTDDDAKERIRVIRSKRLKELKAKAADERPFSEQIKAAKTAAEVDAVFERIPADDRDIYLAAKDARKAELAEAAE